ncbi:hypothetical protein NPA13_02310 [Mycoplasma sp. 2045]|uniref:hypothetical protein n=1 Tax=unclassified Mycoplasma TaxID=2683645 RepID=UPI00211C85F1|nr:MULTISPECIES: hypothetical protein [unclassified Mycoplasma]MEA4134369.1 hypothetical protein [Mycoplasma sp. 2704]MEA4206010.1 hypothetical protein [Mycoplasma sp. 1199]MEA4276218.1 hypothetical protein [Mycoplasma sp. 21DD0573]UUM20271.1 hypothetical protein NPA13_02310 [Mycoplasma sp. 2045]
MKNVRTKVVIWAILTVVALVAIIGLSILINNVQSLLDIKKTTLDAKILQSYQYTKAYSIGGLAFSCLLFLMGSVITYAGIKSWRYSEMLG